MNPKRSVVVAGALSALFIGASAAFAVGSGVFSSGAADKVGTFQAIEQSASIRRPTSNDPSSTTRPGASTSTSTSPAVGATVPDTETHDSQPAAGSGDDESPRTTTTATNPTSPPPTIDPSTTSTTEPEHEVEPPDDGRGSDD